VTRLALTPTERVAFNPRHAIARHLNKASDAMRIALVKQGYDRFEAIEEARIRLDMARMIRTQGVGKEWVV